MSCGAALAASSARLLGCPVREVSKLLPGSRRLGFPCRGGALSRLCVERCELGSRGSRGLVALAARRGRERSWRVRLIVKFAMVPSALKNPSYAECARSHNITIRVEASALDQCRCVSDTANTSQATATIAAAPHAELECNQAAVQHSKRSISGERFATRTPADAQRAQQTRSKKITKNAAPRTRCAAPRRPRARISRAPRGARVSGDDRSLRPTRGNGKTADLLQRLVLPLRAPRDPGARAPRGRRALRLGGGPGLGAAAV